ncbi:MAG: hypothetical protein AAFR61_25095 [Bacteroidota bacterium]
MFFDYPCLSVVRNSYALLLSFFTLSFCCASLSGQTPAYTSTFLPQAPQAGDTAHWDVSLDEYWWPNGEDDTLELVYTYRGHQVDPASNWQFDSLAGFFSQTSWSYEFEVDQAAYELRLRLIFPSFQGPAPQGFLLSGGGIEITIDEIILRQGQPTEALQEHSPRVYLRKDRVDVQAGPESLLQTLAIFTLNGQRVLDWEGDAPRWQRALALSPNQIYVFVMTTTRGRFVQRWVLKD